MIKKIVLASSLLVGTMASAEISQKGFFVGVDFSQSDYKVSYENDGTFTSAAYDVNDKENITSFKVGYQYYFTRVYGRYSNFKYEDTAKNHYTAKGSIYELNADYIPVLYTHSSKVWNIRGIFGIGIGYNDSKMDNFTDTLLIVGPASIPYDGKSQDYMEYGYQIGIMTETSIGLSVEAAYRARYGTLQEFTAPSSADRATFDLVTQEFYLGVNYLF